MSPSDAMMEPRAFEAFTAALAEARARPGSVLIVNAVTGETRAHPGHQPIPPDWYRLAIHIKPSMPCAA